MSVRIRTRSDGSTVAQVRFRLDGRETSLSFNDAADATRFDQLVTNVGAARAVAVTRSILGADPQAMMTLGQWLTHYNQHLTGIEEQTVKRYEAMAAKERSPELHLQTLIALDIKHISKLHRCRSAG